MDRVEYARSEFPEGSLWVYVNEEQASTYGVKNNMYRDAFNVNRGICEFTIIRAFNDFSNEIGETKSIVFEDVTDLKKYFVSSWSSKQKFVMLHVALSSLRNGVSVECVRQSLVNALSSASHRSHSSTTSMCAYFAQLDICWPS